MSHKKIWEKVYTLIMDFSRKQKTELITNYWVKKQVKKLVFLTEASAKALNPLPLCCLRIYKLLFTWLNIHVFETRMAKNGWLRKNKKVWLLRKQLEKAHVLMDTIALTAQNVFAHSYTSEYSKHYFSFWEKNLYFQAFSKGLVDPPSP